MSALLSKADIASRTKQRPLTALGPDRRSDAAADVGFGIADAGLAAVSAGKFRACGKSNGSQDSNCRNSDIHLKVEL
jgi:hypothetical protein